MRAHKNVEELKLFRLIMVLSSISPLFILWGIHGNSLISDKYFVTFCILMIVIPYVFLGIRIWIVWKQDDKRELVIGSIEDSRSHILVYLFAMLLPLYTAEIDTWREFTAIMVALVFIVFLFWHLNLYYMNILFAIFNYHIYTIYPSEDNNPLSGKTANILITKRKIILKGERITAYRVSNTVYIEIEVKE